MLFYLLFQCGTLFSQCAGQCPHCNQYTGYDRTGHGTQNSKTIYNVFIDSTWDDSPGHTTPVVYNGVSDAINAWNSKQAASSCYGGNTIPYVLQLNQGGGTAQADIVIEKVSDGTYSSCAVILPGGQYDTINLPAALLATHYRAVIELGWQLMWNTRSAMRLD